MDLLTTHRPRDCALLVGIPVTMEDYRAYEGGALESDFLRQSGMTTAGFLSAVCEPVGESLERIRCYGASVATRVDEGKIADAFRRDVVVLLSHWSGDRIEVYGGMLPAAAFAARIPEDYAGVVDLCACHPEGLADAILARCPGATVKYTLVSTTASIWSEVVRLTLLLLRRHRMSYVEALQTVLSAVESTARPAAAVAAAVRTRAAEA